MAPDVTSTVTVSLASAAPVTARAETEAVGRELTVPSTVTTMSASLAETVMLLPPGLPMTVQAAGGPRASTSELEPDVIVPAALPIDAGPPSFAAETSVPSPAGDGVSEVEAEMPADPAEEPLDPPVPPMTVAPESPETLEASGGATGSGVAAPERSGTVCVGLASRTGAESCVVPSVAVTATLGSTVTGEGSAGAGVLWSDRVVVEWTGTADVVETDVPVELEEAHPSDDALSAVAGLSVSDEDAPEADASVGDVDVPASVTGVETFVGAAAGADETSGGAPTVSSTTGGCGPGFRCFAGAGTVV